MTDPVARVADILENSARYPWKTAKYLRRRLAEDGTSITTAELEAALLEHAANEDRVLRYSFFPARKSLDLLWGHVGVVKDPSDLPDPHLETEFGEFDPCGVPEGRPWCFLSHSFLDLPRVKPLYERLLDQGYGVWLAEAEVMKGTMIVKAVQEGLQICDHLVLVATPNSLASRWVLKEVIQSIHHRSIPVNGAEENREMISLFTDWLEDRWDHSIGERVDALEPGGARDPDATMLSDLLVEGLGDGVPPDRRVVVLDPFPAAPPGAGFRTFEEVFPELA